MVPGALVFCVSASEPPWGGGRLSQSSLSFISFYKVSFHIWFSLTKKKFLATRKYLKTTGTDEAVRFVPIFRAEISSLLIHWIENLVRMQSPTKIHQCGSQWLKHSLASLNCLDYKDTVIVTLPNMRLVQGQTTWSLLLAHNSRTALTWVIFHELRVCISGSCVSLESQCGSCVAHKTGDLIRFHW